MKRNYVLAVVMILLIVSMPICFSAQYNLTYDNNGNLISGDGFYRVYNSFNQLWKIYNGTNSSGVLLESYVYSPVSESIDIKYVYNSTGAIKETTYYWTEEFRTVVNASGEFNITNVYQEGQLISETKNGVMQFMHTDIKGNIVAVTNSTGQMIANNTYSPYGEITSGGSASKLGYEAKEYDPVVRDLDFHFRKYNPSWGIFLQPDTLIQNVYDPQSLNHYMFEIGNPIKNTDNTGHITGLDDAVAILTVSFVTGFVIGGGVELHNQITSGNGINIGTILSKGAEGGIATTVGSAIVLLVGLEGAAAFTFGLAFELLMQSKEVGHETNDVEDFTDFNKKQDKNIHDFDNLVILNLPNNQKTDFVYSNVNNPDYYNPSLGIKVGRIVGTGKTNKGVDIVTTSTGWIIAKEYVNDFYNTKN